MFWPFAAQAQELFVRKTAPPAAEGEAAQEKPKAVPLFLPKAQAPKTGKPLFLDAPQGGYVPARPSSKVYTLKQKKPDELTAEERMSVAMEDTRLANLANIQSETARLQAQTMQALAKWEADSAAEAARQAALAAAPVPAAAVPKTPVAPLKRSVTRTPETDGDKKPRPVFNTGR